MIVRVVCAGIPRSGTTVLYNLLRIGLADAGFQALGHVDALSRIQLASYSQDVIVKSHVVEASAARHAFVVQSWRPIDAVASSANRIWGYNGRRLNLLLSEASENYRSLIREGALCLSYSELVDSRAEVLAAIRKTLILPELASGEFQTIDRDLEQLESGEGSFGRFLAMRSAMMLGRLRVGELARRVGMSPSLVDDIRRRLVRPDPTSLLLPRHRSSAEHRTDLKFDRSIDWPSDPASEGSVWERAARAAEACRQLRDPE